MGFLLIRMRVLYLRLPTILESISKWFQRFQSLWKSPIFPLSHGFSHETFSNSEIWCYWCIIDVFQWKSPWTLDLLETPKFGLWIGFVTYDLMLIELDLVYVVLLISMVIYAIVLWIHGGLRNGDCGYWKRVSWPNVLTNVELI